MKESLNKGPKINYLTLKQGYLDEKDHKEIIFTLWKVLFPWCSAYAKPWVCWVILRPILGLDQVQILQTTEMIQI